VVPVGYTVQVKGMYVTVAYTVQVKGVYVTVAEAQLNHTYAHPPTTFLQSPTYTLSKGHLG